MTLPALAGAWLWDAFGKDIVKYAANQLWDGFNWLSAAQRYRDNLYEQYKEVQIFGQPEPVPLEGIFTHLNILDKPTAFSRYSIDALRETARRDPRQFRAEAERLVHSRADRVDGLTLVIQPDNDRLFILGKPGSGKTTFLKYVALQAAKGKIDKVPIFVSLKAWADSGLALPVFVARQFELCGFPNAQPFVNLLLRNGLALVLFDALDEVDQKARERMRLISTLTDFSEQYRQSQVIVTCRIAATDYTFRGFKYVEVADFNEGQMYAFIRKWFKDDSFTRGKFWEEFQRDEHRGLRELGRIPLLLTLLCLAFQETLSFPQRRVEIYQQALDALLKKWDASRKVTRDDIYYKLSLGRKCQMLARIAAGTFEQGSYFFRQAELEKWIVAYLQNLPPADLDEDIDGTAVLKAIEAQHSILGECAQRIYTFVHLSFQEYFTAKFIVENAAQGTLTRLLSHCTDDRWREVILITASLLDDADIFSVEFRRVIDNLIADDETVAAFIRWAEDKATSVEARYKPAALRSWYCYLALDLARHIDHNPARDYAFGLVRDIDRDLALDLVFTRDLDRERALIISPDRYLDVDRALAHELALILDINHDLARALARVFARARTFDLDRDPSRARDLARDLANTFARDRDLRFARSLALDLTRARTRAQDLAQDLALDLALGLALALALDRAGAYDRALAFDRICARACALACDLAPELHKILAELRPPARGASQRVWLAFADQLRAIMAAHRNIGQEWNFTQEQVSGLSHYFNANRLLVKCLDLAYVSDRAAIENRLLWLPDLREGK
jgi:hypothetical protein